MQGFLRAVSVPRIAMLANTVLVLMLAYTLAGVTWLVVAGHPQPYVPVSMEPLGGRAKGGEAPSLSTLADMHLLGEAGKTQVVAQEEPIEAPETRLNLELKGLFAVDTPEAAMAIIASGGRDEQSYRVGQSVAGAATVHQILPDRVILKRGERFETLTLPKDLLPGQDSTPVRGGGGPSPQSGAAVRTLPGLQERIIQDPQQALSLIDARPEMEGGQLKGYRLQPGKERALFSRAGLRPNDVVTEVNGIPLSDTARLGELMQQFNNSSRVELTLERAGQPVTLSLDLK